mmetsp:Transcript_15127/g.51064  ORF Transcript_15127/g.51064 Transcript_15127/m.51064 type:complete len:403 (+) Transcript_15127:129-1337(+)
MVSSGLLSAVRSLPGDVAAWTRADQLTLADWRAVASNVFLFGLVLGMAGTIDPRSFWARVREGKAVALGILCQFALLPLLGFAVVRAFDLDPTAGVTLLITTTSPGGGFSGLLCFLCNADLALSVAMTSASTVLAMALIPLNVLIYIRRTYGVAVELPWAGLATTVGVVVVAVALGLVLAARRPRWKGALNRAGTVCGVLNIAVAGASSSASEQPFWEQPPLFMVAVGLPCLAGLVTAFVLAKVVLRVPPPQAVAICIECCYQNTALAITVALSVFKEDAGYAVGVPLLYGIAEPLVIGPFCLLAWRMGWTYAPRGVGLCAWLWGNFQPEEGPEGAPAGALESGPGSPAANGGSPKGPAGSLVGDSAAAAGPKGGGSPEETEGTPRRKNSRLPAWTKRATMH